MNFTPKCQWILTHGQITAQCGAPATHRCLESGSTFCDFHAEDYADCFGDDSLTFIPAGATPGHQAPS